MSRHEDPKSRDATEMESFVLQQALALYIEHQRQYGRDPEEQLFLEVASRLLDAALAGGVDIRDGSEFRETRPFDIRTLIGDASLPSSSR